MLTGESTKTEGLYSHAELRDKVADAKPADSLAVEFWVCVSDQATVLRANYYHLDNRCFTTLDIPL